MHVQSPRPTHGAVTRMLLTSIVHNEQVFHLDLKKQNQLTHKPTYHTLLHLHHAIMCINVTTRTDTQTLTLHQIRIGAV